LENIYAIKVNEPTLRELLVAQSIFTCTTVSHVSEIVSDQPRPLIFNKVFLELEMRSLMTFLAFDRRSISSILK
jgi:fibrillarin-like rRNA methylase